VLSAASWRALGTSVHLLTDDLDIEAAQASVERVLDEVDRAYSRFRSDSELQIVQARPGRDVRVSPLLATAIAAALRAARQTDGAVDPTIGRAMRAIGYDDDFASVAARNGPFHVRLEPVPGWRAIRFDARNRTLCVPAGVELDLGSTGKALAADLAATAALAGSPTGGVLVSLGGDISTVGRAPAGGWRILAAEDSEMPPAAGGEVIAIDGGAVATSSTVVRRWQSAGGATLHHLIDPQTGGPVNGPWRTASVVADSCVDANTAATAAIVLGDAAVLWLESAGLPARLVGQSGEVVRLGHWPRPVSSPVVVASNPGPRRAATGSVQRV
jgi:thiamine biosynthesis lipoprotein ApbE